MLDERKRIRRHRQAVARKQAENKAFWIDVAAVLGAMIISAVIIVGTVSIIL